MTESSSDNESTSTPNDEEAFLSKDILSNNVVLPPKSTWASDTGATSHMSNQRHLFRDLARIGRRRIRVDGGVLYADYRGIVDIVYADRSRMSLQDVLYVPSLGINLLSGRRIYDAGLKGSFDAKHIYFKLGNKKIITSIITDGLYLVTHVSKRAGEVAYPAIIED